MELPSEKGTASQQRIISYPNYSSFITVEPPIMDLPRKGQPPNKDTVLDSFPIAVHSSFLTSEKRTASQRGQNGWFQSVFCSEVPLHTLREEEYPSTEDKKAVHCMIVVCFSVHLHAAAIICSTATQMWCLARLLPLMIGNDIEEGDRYWENYLCLLSIVDYCMAPVVSKDWAAYLRMLINEHHTEFTALYPSVRKNPKSHYIVHYPDIMCKYVFSYYI